MNLRSTPGCTNIAKQQPEIGHSSPLGVSFETTLKNTTLAHYDNIKNTARSLAISRGAPLQTLSNRQPELQQSVNSTILQIDLIRQNLSTNNEKIVSLSVKTEPLGA